MRQVSFKISELDRDIVNKIVMRYILSAVYIYQHDVLLNQQEDIWKDIVACHCNGNPLDLAAFLQADDFNFQTDLIGIRENLNRSTGALDNGFVTRFLKHDEAA